MKNNKILLILTAIALLNSFLLLAQETTTPSHIPRITSEIKVDGVLNEAAWKSAYSVELRYEILPGDNTEAVVPSTCYITFDDANLYIALRCEDPEGALIRAHLSDRDNLGADDYIGIKLDTFNTQRSAFVFEVNPRAIQSDSMHSGQQNDPSWDAIWSSAAKIHDWGYAVEIAIPFDQLRFENTREPKIWGLDVYRVFPRDVIHVSSIIPIDRNNNCYHCQMVKIEGFEDIVSSQNIELTPTFTAFNTDSQKNPSTGNFENQESDAEIGLTGKWGVTPDITVQGTINPDFSQVEADALRLNINEPFALFYREKRPFFTEGSNYFETQANRHAGGLGALHTRSIRDPLWGVKITGRAGSRTFGGFVVNDSLTNIIFPGNETSRSVSLLNDNYSSAFRLTQEVGNKFTLGTLVTDREGDDYYNRVLGVDGDFRFTNQDRLVVQVIGSTTKYPQYLSEEFGQNKDEFSDTLLSAHFEHGTRNYKVYANYVDVGSHFRADMGYMPRVDFRKAEIGYTHIIWGEEDSFFNKITLDANYDETHMQSGDLMEKEIELYALANGPMQSTSFVYYGARERSYAGFSFDQEFKGFEFRFKPTSYLTLSFWDAYEDKIDYAHSRPGAQHILNPAMTLNMNNHLSLAANYMYTTFDVDNGRLYSANTLDTSVRYHFSSRMFVRAIVQFTDINRNLDNYQLDVKPEDSSIFSQLLFSYKINPRTVFFLGYTDRYLGTDQMAISQTDRTVFFKLGYAWTM